MSFDVPEHAALTTGVHGVGTGAVVGTTLTQVLTNKTLTSPKIQGTVDPGTGLTMPAFSMSGTLTFLDPSFCFITFGLYGLRQYGSDIATCDLVGNVQRAGFICKGLATASDGLVGFFGVTQVARQTGCAVPTDLPTAIAAITALRTALNNLGLTTVV